MTYAIGKVRWFNHKLGYGFLQHHSGRAVFVHFSAIGGPDGEYKRLSPNELVEYEYVQTSIPGRLRAMRATWVGRNYRPPMLHRGDPSVIFS